MVKVVINTSKKYGSYLAKHLQKEHPKTKGKVFIDYCEMCGSKTKKSKIRYDKIHICNKCLRKQYK